MAAPTNEPTAATDREIVSVRDFDAPRERVFNAWIEPGHLARWWGPKGFTNTFKEFDPRPDGFWRFTMHGPNGANFQNESVFVEILKPRRIVFRHVSPPGFLVTATFDEIDGKARLTWRMVFDSVADFDKVKTYAVEGNRENLDRLEAHLALMT